MMLEGGKEGAGSKYCMFFQIKWLVFGGREGGREGAREGGSEGAREGEEGEMNI